MSQIYGNGVALTQKTLDYLWARQTVTMNNIANVDTPGFKSQYVTFEDEMQSRMSDAYQKNKMAAAIDNSRLSLHTTWTETSRLDGNNVDMDQEQVELVRTAYEYQAMVSSVSNDLSRLRTAVKAF